ncbi:MAG: hypothetical protein KDE05_03595, partial [Parvularculaceae bacterium]|nr:hypothetical protein [Parvularculaceae bacterium]
HYVSPEMDAGPIIGQAAIRVLADDTPQTLAERILRQEHRLYPECVKRIASGAIRLQPDGVVTIADASADDSLCNPSPA